MNLNWFISRTARLAAQMRKHVWKILSEQRDLLSPHAIEVVEGAMQRVDGAVRGQLDKTALQEAMANLEETANKWLKAHPNAGVRENIEVLLVAIAVAMGIRTFFLQPFKIPTGSMQPTLYGITSTPNFKDAYAPPEDLRPPPDFEIPNPVSRFLNYWFSGVSYTHLVTESDGPLQEAKRAQRFLLFNLWQKFRVGDTWYTVWFPDDELLQRAGLLSRGGTPNPRVFKKGEDIMKIRVFSGDHLFVDRMTYNFRKPTRGEIIVFETRGINGLPQDQFYIKRLVSIGGENVRLGNDRHLVINGTNRLDAATPHFENVYGFDPQQLPRDSHYSGHLNNTLYPGIARYFPDENTDYLVPPGRYLVMGDNTMNSHDSRGWGDFDSRNVIGRSFVVYWPFGRQDGRDSRFGLTRK